MKRTALFSSRLSILPFYLLTCLLFLFTQCKKEGNTAQVDNPVNYREHIRAYTSGTVSRESPIKIVFAQAQNADQEILKPLTLDVFDISPSVTGETFWEDDQTLVFKPTDLLSSDQVYEVTFDLEKIISEVPNEQKEFRFNFKTYQQSLSVRLEGTAPYDPAQLKWQKLSGLLETADFAESAKVEAALSAQQKSYDLGIQWEHSADGRAHRFVVDSIIREEGVQEVSVRWNGRSLGLDVDDHETVIIPSITEFKVVDAFVQQKPEQQIIVRFSDPLKPGQNFNGLVRLLNGKSLRFVADGTELRATPQSRLSGSSELRIENSIRNHANYRLSEAFATELRFENVKPAIRLVGNGVILPSSDGLNFPFQAVNLRAVEVKVTKIFENNIGQFLQVNKLAGNRQLKRVGRIAYKGKVDLTAAQKVDLGNWNTFSINLSNLIETEPGAIYRVELAMAKEYSLYACATNAAETENEFIESVEEVADYGGDWNGNGYSEYNDYDYQSWENYQWNERENPCDKSYFIYQRNNNRKVRNVLASDLGIIAKGGDAGNLHVAVTDLVSTDKLANVKVGIYNFQQQRIGEAFTDAEGMAQIPLEKRPFLLIAEKETQRGYLRLDDGSALSLSMFDVSGNASKKGVKGFIYGDRGVWRPGDSLFVSFMLEDKQQVLPKGHPVIFELFNPSSQLVQRKVLSRPVGSLFDFRTKTNPEDPTGNWLAKVSVGGSSFTKNLKIETVKPNRLKITFDFGQEVLQANSVPSALLKATWLHGATAKKLKADVSIRLSQQKTTFPTLEGYVFDDASQEFYSDERVLFEGQLNASGEATVTPNVRLTDAAPGMLNAKFKTRVFENSGDFSTDQFDIPYSPFTSYVGYKVPEGKAWNGGLTMNDTYKFPIATVNPKGKPVARSGLKVQVFRLDWRWWWESTSGESLGRYVRGSSRNLVGTQTVETSSNGKGTFDFKVNEYGRYFVQITDTQSGHSAGKIVYAYWNDGEGEAIDLPGGASMLSFRTDKTTYQTGETVTATLPTGGAGKALVSIENGATVLKSFWVDAQENETEVTFETTPEMAPNAFVSISLVQPHNFTKNDLPIRLYGIHRIKVEDPKTLLAPRLEMPDVLEPEKAFTVKVSESNDKSMSYTLAIVDEGLLDLTRFRTPAPHRHFYAPDALGVKTWDMYDEVMGAYAGEMAGLLELGGDEMLAGKGGKKANRFKPVVQFVGPFELPAGATHTHQLEMPNYVGSVRAMLVAGDPSGAYGNTEKAVQVKKPLMVLATLPRVLGPEETVQLPVTVFAMEDNIRNVEVKVETNELLSLTGNRSQTIRFSETGDQVVNFELKVARAVGVGKATVTVSSQGKSARHAIEIQVRNPNPPMTAIRETVIDGKQEWQQAYQAIGINGTNSATLEISNIPPLNLESRLEYLIQYPHGCVEQTTSSVFPQLHLAGLLQLSEEQKKEIDFNIKKGIERLTQRFQLPNGGMAYWPGANDVSEWGTNYAGHFLIEAKEKGYVLPFNFLRDWVRYQQREANHWVESDRYSYRSSTLIQAYRLYTLALAGKPATGAMNRLRETKDLPEVAKWRLAGAYALIGQSEVAKNLVKSLGTSVQPYRELGYSYGSSLRDRAMILEVLNLLDRKSDAKRVIDEISKELSARRWLSTQATAYSLLAVAKFIGKNKAGDTMRFNYITAGKAEKIQTDLPIFSAKIPDSGNVTVQNQTDGILFAKVILRGTPATDQQEAYSNNLSMKVRYTDLEGNTLDVGSLAQGTDLMAQVTIENPGNRGNYEEMALTQVFPSGWEIRNLRFEGDNHNLKSDVPEYQDIRDDRVLTYFDLPTRQSKTFKVLLHAAYEGKFFLPSAYSEAMYDNEIAARQEGRWINVKRAGGGE